MFVVVARLLTEARLLPNVTVKKTDAVREEKKEAQMKEHLMHGESSWKSSSFCILTSGPGTHQTSLV